MKIGVFVPDQKMEELVNKTSDNMANVDLFPIIAYPGKSDLEYAKEMISDKKLDVIIARNPAGYFLRDVLDIPVAIMHISRIDFIRAVSRCEVNKTIAFVFLPQDSNKYSFNLFELEGIANHPVKLYKASEDYKPDRILNDNVLNERGLNDFLSCDYLITGTPKLGAYAHEHGMNVISIQFDEFELHQAIEEAVSLYENRRKEMEALQLLEIALNATKNGYLVVQNNKILIANECICEMSNMKRNDIVGENTEKLSQISSFFEQTFSVRRKEIINYEKHPYSVLKKNIQSDYADVASGMELISIIDVPEIQKTESTIRQAMRDRGFSAKWTFYDILASSSSMKQAIMTARQYAASDLSVLITGESGTGKEVFAQSIHNASPYAKGPFVAFNCAAFPENLIESELFGYEEGSFTGARKGGKLGLLELAHGGTLFLDEIGEMPIGIQAKFLRSLQEKQVYRIGGDRIIPVDVRLVCATNQDLKELISQHLFREDLYYRINVLNLHIPPIRERKEDIPLFVSDFFRRNIHKPVENETVDSLSFNLCQYDWPGNVRELENYLSRLLVMRRSGLSFDELKKYIESSFSDKKRDNLNLPMSGNESDDYFLLKPGTLDQMEKEIILKAFEKCGHNIKDMSEELDIGYTTAWRKLKQFGAES